MKVVGFGCFYLDIADAIREGDGVPSQL